MNILLINHYAGTPKLGMEYRPYFLAKEWSKKGHVVTIIASSESHYRQLQPGVSKKITLEVIDGINYMWVKTPKYNGNGLGRFINILSFVLFLWTKAKYISTLINPNVVIASSTYPLDNYPSKKIAKLSKSKYIFEIHDLWPLSPIELGGYSVNHPFIKLLQHSENYAYRNCDLVVSILPKTLEHTVSHGLQSNKWHHIPNGIVLGDWGNSQSLSETENDLLDKLISSKQYSIAYTGAIGLANALDVFIEASKLASDLPINFFIVGGGTELDNLKQKAKHEKLSNLYFIDPIVKQKMPSLLDKFDILYIGLKNESLFRFGISPNKMFDYMMAAKPIIQSINAGNDMVSEANCGFSIPPENPKAVVGAIQKLIALADSERAQLGANGKNYVINNHDYRKLADNFLNLMQNNLKKR